MQGFKVEKTMLKIIYLSFVKCLKYSIMRKLLISAIFILIFACSDNKETERVQSESPTTTTRSETRSWILEQPVSTYVLGEELKLQCSCEDYQGEIQSVALQMRVDNSQNYVTISPKYCNDLNFNGIYAFKLGICHIKGIIYLLVDAENHIIEKKETNELEFRVMGPLISDLMNLDKVFQRMNECWENSKSSEASHARIEFGFTLQMHTYSNAAPEYSFIDGSAIPSKDCGMVGSIINSISFTIEDEENEESASYSVALFHTHPPLTNCPNTVSRVTGSSGLDDGVANEHEIPSVVLDYDINIIHGGHSSSLPYKIYYAGGYDQRL